jgi:soluble lytic murein transglycosylase-like protein
MDWQRTLQSIRQFSLPHTRALRQQLDEVSARHARVETELVQVREEAARTRESDQQQIAGLQLQLSHIEVDRDHARKQAQLLDATLQQAAQHQQQTDQRVHALEAQLEEARHEHESNLYLTRDVLQRMQAEQKSLLSTQSDMTHTFQEVSTELLQSLHRESRSRFPLLQFALVAGLLFIAGALTTALVLRDSSNSQLDLGGISKGIDELQLLMQAHFRTHEELLEKLTRVLDHAPGSAPPSPALPAPGVPGSGGGADLPQPAVPETHGMLAPGATGMQSAAPASVAAAPSPALPDKTMRADLRVLGLLSAGADARHALHQFLVFYRQEVSPAEMQQQMLHDFAVLAREDARKYEIASGVAAAIRLASLRTGVEFSYLMELASIESSFNPQARAKTTTASGLYQFKEESWLDAVKSYGGRYALGDVAAHIEHAGDADDADATAQPRIADAALLQQVLALRMQPHYAALMAAERVRTSRSRLASTLEREPGRTDLYLTHFFGTTGAISFLKALHENPDRIAGEIFPGPAHRNSSIFHKRNNQPRTVAEVYQLLARKFNTDRYDEG